MLLVLLSVGILGWSFLVWTPPPMPLPNPNGYDDLIKAAQAVAGKIDDATELEHEGLRTLITTNAEALRLLRIGLSRRCAVPTDSHIANFETVVMGDLIGLKRLAKLLSAEGRLAEIENRPSDAARSYTDAIHLGRQISRGGLMIHRLVGIACEGLVSKPLPAVLPKLTCEQLTSLAAELEGIDHSTVLWREVLQNEKRFARADTGDFEYPIALVSSWWRARSIRRGVQEKHEVASARLRLLTVEVALRSYKCRQGRAAETLAQLTPKYLRSAPIDPFSGKPLIYRLSGTNWVLYSLGPDRKNDGGKPLGTTSENHFLVFGSARAGTTDKGDLLYDSKW